MLFSFILEEHALDENLKHCSEKRFGDFTKLPNGLALSSASGVRVGYHKMDKASVD